MGGVVDPICYGTVEPGNSRNMTSFAGHNFVLKRLVWSLDASSAAADAAASATARALSLGAGAAAAGAAAAAAALAAGSETPAEAVTPLVIETRQRAHEWDAEGSSPSAPPSAAPFAQPPPAQPPPAPPLPPMRAVNRLSQPAEVCSVPRWASRLLQGSMPAGLETCHGVVAVNATLELPALPADAVLLARQLVGVATIAKRVPVYPLVPQELSADFMRRIVKAMKGGRDGAGGKPSPAGGRPPPAPPPRKAAATPPLPPGVKRSATPSANDSGGWQPLLGDAAAARPSLKAKCEGLLLASDGAAHAAAVRELSARAATSAVTRSASRRARALRFLSQRLSAKTRPVGDQTASAGATSGASRAAGAAGSAASVPLTVLVAGDAHELAMEFGLALALGGVRELRVISRDLAERDGGGSQSQEVLWHQWGCAIGVDVSVVNTAGATESANAADATADAAAVDGAPRAHLAVLGPPLGSKMTPHVAKDDAPSLLALWWAEARWHAADDAIVIGTRPASIGAASSTRSYLSPEHTYSFVSGKAHAMALHLADDTPSALGAVPCAACAQAVTKLIGGRCELRAVDGANATEMAQAREVLRWLQEAASGWPVGYRLATGARAWASGLGSRTRPTGSRARWRCVTRMAASREVVLD